MNKLEKFKYGILLLSLIGCNALPEKESVIIPEEKKNKTENTEMAAYNGIELTREKLEEISPADIIYAESAEGGGMGNAGGVIIYILEAEQLMRYETSMFEAENVFEEASTLLVQHQNVLKKDKHKQDEILFDYHYGGMGNHVFIRKNILLKKEKDHLLYLKENNAYQIYCSVLGVFNAVSYSLENTQYN